VTQDTFFPLFFTKAYLIGRNMAYVGNHSPFGY
jgi:hypothetical protein